MKRTTYICDRCKREIVKTAPIRIFGEYINRDGSENEHGRCLELEDHHFCSDCANTLFSLITRNCKKGVHAVKNPDFEAAVEDMIASRQEKNTRLFCDPNISATSSENEEETEESHKKRLDVGKIHALKNAGWPVKKIADEMNCSLAAVYKVLQRKPGTQEEHQEE